jgi:hypothetical protein
MKISAVLFMVCAFSMKAFSLASASSLATGTKHLAGSDPASKVLVRGTHTLMTPRGASVNITIQSVGSDKLCSVCEHRTYVI